MLTDGASIAGNTCNSKLELQAFFEHNQENITVSAKLDP